MPLFPGYLFIALDAARERWRSVRSTIGVSELLCAGERPTPVPAGAVEAIRAKEDARGYVAVSRRAPLRRDATVRVVEGAFADLVGLFDCADDNERVTVLLNLLGRQVKIRVPLTAVTVTA